MSHPALTWTAHDTPVATAFDDPYFTGGVAETAHVFLAGNGLPARFRDGFQVAELGFGTGLNLLAVAQACAAPICFTSFEAYPMRPEDMARALAPFQLPWADDLVAAWRVSDGPVRRFTVGSVVAEVHIGDARETVAAWTGAGDAWFLDGFAPARNPELWGDDLLAQVAQHTAAGGTVATYTAAGHVRRALEAAGFSVTRQSGYGRKKHMTTGSIPG